MKKLLRTFSLFCKNVSYNTRLKSVPWRRFERSNSSMMKAVCLHQFGPPGVLNVEEICKPSPKSTEVLCEVHSAGINPIDTYIREGSFHDLRAMPLVLGKEVAGVVVQVGSRVKNIQIGQRVTCCLPCDLGYAEYVVCDENKVIPLSDRLTFNQGATLYVAYFSAMRALITKCKVKKDEILLVHGASGAVGIAAVQIGKLLGLHIVATAGTEEGIAVVKSLGVQHVFNHWKTGYTKEAMAATQGEGFDAIVENCSHINLGADLELLKNGGRVAVIGAKGSVEVNPRYLLKSEGEIYGINLFSVKQDEFNDYTRILEEGIEQGVISPIIGKEFSMSDIPCAHALLMNETGAKGKLVLKVR